MSAKPWLRADAEAAGKYAVSVIRKKPKQYRDDDPELAAWCAQWAWHWAHLAMGRDDGNVTVTHEDGRTTTVHSDSLDPGHG